MLRAVEWVDEWERVEGALEADAGRRVAKLASGAERVFARYFAGELHALRELDVHFSGTPFQMRVWNALREIPVGETRSYRALGEAIGAPRAVRAVGTANGRNPLAIVVPCHRVI
ncbi:MAG: methylated-DNA--[protein]-cysteine S-methyltransferase, partial [Gemmatimonadetes bacterium]|nr:methylated-DNA--[protein]-cysteine S-methyltransferase [Gemmatimonadota bacterium]